MAQFVSNPFQVLGVSDVPDAPVPVASLSPSDITAAPVEPVANANGLHAGGGPMAAAPKERLTFLYHLGNFFMQYALPLAEQLGIQFLERKL